MRDIPPESGRQYGVFTAQQAYQLGWSEVDLSRAAQRSQLLRLRRGAYCLPVSGTRMETEQHLLGLRGVAVALRVPRATVSHASALSLYGLPLLDLPVSPSVVLPPPLRTREADLWVHRQQLPVAHVAQHGNIALTTAARSCLDHGREFGLAAALVAADAAIARGLISPAELDEVYHSLRGRAGWPAGGTLSGLVDGRSESALESISRLAMVGLDPAPELQTVIRTADGRFVARVDFFWRELGIVGEADGRAKYTGDALWREKRREQLLADLGLVIVRWGWDEARQPVLLRNLLGRAFTNARLLRGAGVIGSYRVA